MDVIPTKCQKLTVIPTKCQKLTVIPTKRSAWRDLGTVFLTLFATLTFPPSGEGIAAAPLSVSFRSSLRISPCTGGR